MQQLALSLGVVNLKQCFQPASDLFRALLSVDLRRLCGEDDVALMQRSQLFPQLSAHKMGLILEKVIAVDLSKDANDFASKQRVPEIMLLDSNTIKTLAKRLKLLPR